MTFPATPDSSEYAPFYKGYISELDASRAASLLATQAATIAALARAAGEERGTYRYAQGKWSVKEILGHITDAERIFAARLLRIARGDKTPLPGFEQDGYVASAGADSRRTEDLAREFAAVRAATISLIETLGEREWSEAGTASGNPVTARAIGYIIVGHAEHHVRALRERYGISE